MASIPTKARTTEIIPRESAAANPSHSIAILDLLSRVFSNRTRQSDYGPARVLRASRKPCEAGWKLGRRNPGGITWVEKHAFVSGLNLPEAEPAEFDLWSRDPSV
jgi:hypothetical protein